jgi:hypothetical protein
MNNPPEPVEPGQIWADNDKRGYGRRVTVQSVDGTHATVTDGKRTSHIRLDRFRPTSTGYRLMQNADGTPAAPGGAR